MSQQITDEVLYELIKKEMKKGNGKKLIVLADDTEGNGYHGMFFGFTSTRSGVRECIECSNGVYDSESEDPQDLVILG